MKSQWKLELIGLLNKGLSLTAWSTYLRTLKSNGIAREELRLLLNECSNNTDQEAVNDHILELLDLVEGHCQAQYRVW